MRVTKIRRIRGYRLFQNFTWHSELPAFGQFNLVYGWNGSGKTTLSTLFRHLQSRTLPESGEVEFEVDGRSIPPTSIPTAALPEIRVFNRDFVAATVFEANNPIAPIYYFGSDSAENQRAVERLREDLGGIERSQLDAKAAARDAANTLDSFCVSNAKLIKELLISSRSTNYNNYDKKRLTTALKQLTPETARSALLSDEEKTRARLQKDALPKEATQAIRIAVKDAAVMARQTEVVIGRSVVSQVLKELASDRPLGAWAQQGLKLHTGDRASATCRFCGQALPALRLQALEAHFNDAFALAQAEIEEMAAAVESELATLGRRELPDVSRLYDHLADEYRSAAAVLLAECERLSAFLTAMKAALISKRQSPLETATLDSVEATRVVPARSALDAAIDAVNQVLAKHNAVTSEFQRSVLDACERLERCLVAELHSAYVSHQAHLEAMNARAESLDVTASGIHTEIADLEKDILEHRRPAEELNSDLGAYLGRADLRIEVRESGYAISRGGVPASHLSEGERTAVAFLYFLKSLQDRSFDIKNGVVVIDDPVSSLDANSLFAAFGYLRERTRNPGQLIVLTHNFAFFRLVKNWFHKLKGQGKSDPHKRPACLYQLKSATDAGIRTAVLGRLDPLLEDYESEYHYLFKRVLEEATNPANDGSLEPLYDVPNLARRLLESFLAFRFPDAAGELYQCLERVDYEASAKTRVLRFLHTFSHHGGIAEPLHDPSILSETREVLGDLLGIVKHLDLDHYERMVATVTGDAEEPVGT